jgi:hypothetical protein
MQNPAKIVVSLQDRQGVLNIAKWAVGLGNYKGLTDGMIVVGRAQEVIFNSNYRYQWNRKGKAIKSDDE